MYITSYNLPYERLQSLGYNICMSSPSMYWIHVCSVSISWSLFGGRKLIQLLAANIDSLETTNRNYHYPPVHAEMALGSMQIVVGPNSKRCMSKCMYPFRELYATVFWTHCIKLFRNPIHTQNHLLSCSYDKLKNWLFPWMERSYPYYYIHFKMCG